MTAKDNQQKKYRAMQPRKLVSTDNAVDAELIAGVLTQEGISTYTKDLESGDYMSIVMGFSVFGKELYVDEGDYERAKELLEGMRMEGAAAPDGGTQAGMRERSEGSLEEEEIHIPWYRSKLVAARVVLFIVGVPIAAGILSVIWGILFP